MKVLGRYFRASAVVLDIDNTLYPRGDPYFAEGSRNELIAVAALLGCTVEDLKLRIEQAKVELCQHKGVPHVALTDAVLSLGVTAQQWNELRCTAWNPEEWIQPDIGVVRLIELLAQRYTIAFGTNSPKAIGLRVLRCIGIPSLFDSVVFGPEELGFNKPNHYFFTAIARKLGVQPQMCVSVGDREFSDAIPAIAAGFPLALVLEQQSDLYAVLDWIE